MNWRILFSDNVKYIELKLKCPKTFFRVLQLGKDCANKETDALSRGIQKRGFGFESGCFTTQRIIDRPFWIRSRIQDKINGGSGWDNDIYSKEWNGTSLFLIDWLLECLDAGKSWRKDGGTMMKSRHGVTKGPMLFMITDGRWERKMKEN